MKKPKVGFFMVGIFLFLPLKRGKMAVFSRQRKKRGGVYQMRNAFETPPFGFPKLFSEDAESFILPSYFFAIIKCKIVSGAYFGQNMKFSEE